MPPVYPVYERTLHFHCHKHNVHQHDIVQTVTRKQLKLGSGAVWNIDDVIERDKQQIRSNYKCGDIKVTVDPIRLIPKEEE